MKPIPTDVANDQTTDPYRLLFEHTGDMACTLDLRGAFTAVNPAGERLTGYSEAELIGTSAITLIAEESRAEAMRQFERRLASGAIASADESMLVARDGTRIPIEIRSTIFTDAAGVPVGVLGLVHDVSERRAAATALLLSEERLRNAFDDAAIGMALVGLDGRWLQVNESLCRLLGFTRDELLRKTSQDVTHPDDLGVDLAYLQKLLDGEIHGYQMEKRFFDRHGGVVWVQLSVSVVRAEDGGASYFINQIQDITEQRAAQHALERSSAQLAEAQQLAQIGSWERDANGVIWWSREMYRIFGLDPARDHLDETRILASVHPDDRDATIQESQAATAANRPVLLEYRTVLPGGEIRWVQARGETVFAGGKPVGRRGTAQDITKRKEAEADRDRLRNELHRAQQLEAIGRLAGGVAHDFNNMLTAIQGYSELLLGELDPYTPQHAHAAQIKRAADQAATLPRQLLAFGRKQVLEPDVVELGATVRNVEELLQNLVSERVRLDVAAPEAVYAYVDVDKLEQALVNLVLNARDAMPDGGRLSIAIGTEHVDEDVAAEHGTVAGRYSTLSVTDTGHGIEEDVMAKIFEPFFTTKPVGAGSGLGLASVHGTVNQSGGFIRVESEPGKGARFDIFLPTAEQAATADDQSSRIADRLPGVLLAEDEQLVRDLAVSVLERGGFEVRAAANGLDALALFEQHAEAIDVVVTDMVMPEMGGLDLARRVREQRPDTPIVYMSGYTDEAPAAELHADPSSFLQKPFSAETLASAVRDATEPRPGRLGITCVVADDHPAVLDAISQYLEVQGVTVVASCSRGDEALQALEDHQPTVALLDVSMEAPDGLEVTRAASVSASNTRIVLYTGHRDARALASAAGAGAHGLVLKEAPLSELVRALRLVAVGETYLDPEIATLLKAHGESGADASLTPRERQILSLVARGGTNDKVAQTLGISTETVQSHVRNAMGKLHADTRTEAVATAIRNALID